MRLLGQTTCDVYLNERGLLEEHPRKRVGIYIGGYQVIKKWLSYRQHELLGRALRIEEVRHVTDIVRRLTAIVLLQPALDGNYRRVKASTYAWPQT